MSILQKQVIQSLDGLSDENLQFLLDMILRFMKPDKIEEEHNDKLVIIKDNIHRIGNHKQNNMFYFHVFTFI